MNGTEFEGLSLLHACEMRGHIFSQSTARGTFDWTRSKENWIFLLIFFLNIAFTLVKSPFTFLYLSHPLSHLF